MTLFRSPYVLAASEGESLSLFRPTAHWVANGMAKTIDHTRTLHPICGALVRALESRGIPTNALPGWPDRAALIEGTRNDGPAVVAACAALTALIFAGSELMPSAHDPRGASDAAVAATVSPHLLHALAERASLLPAETFAVGASALAAVAGGVTGGGTTRHEAIAQIALVSLDAAEQVPAVSIAAVEEAGPIVEAWDAPAEQKAAPATIVAPRAPRERPAVAAKSAAASVDARTARPRAAAMPAEAAEPSRKRPVVAQPEREPPTQLTDTTLPGGVGGPPLQRAAGLPDRSWRTPGVETLYRLGGPTTLFDTAKP